MDIYKLIKDDHDKARDLLNYLSEVKDLKAFERLKKEIYVHNEAEEEAFYLPLNPKFGDLKILLKSGHDEHDMIMQMMNLLSKITSDEEWSVLFSSIKKSLESHMLMEEEDIFKLSKKYFNTNEAENMARKMEKLKIEIEKSYIPQM